MFSQTHFFFFAFLDEQDAFHEHAVGYFQDFDGHLVTTEWILTELADGFAGTQNRQRFSWFYEELRKEPGIYIIGSDAELFRLGMELYGARSDKAWSLTDCISFVVMRRLGLVEASTGDHISNRQDSPPF